MQQVQATTTSAAPMIPALAPPPGTDADEVFPEPSPSIALSPLFGAPPPVLGDSPDDSLVLQNIYVTQIATLVWTMDSTAIGKPVVVGLALKRGADQPTDEAQARRLLFVGAMKLVKACMRQRDAPSAQALEG